MPRTKKIQVILEHEVYEKLKEISGPLTPFSAHIRVAIDQYLAKHGEAGK